MKLSIVTTLYRSEQYVNEFYELISSNANKITNDYEIVFVNDGSPDNSVERVLEIRKKDNKVKLIDLSRNFGHHYAIMAGLNFASGEYIYLTDCDLEVSPETIIAFNDKIVQQKIDVVYGFQETRKGRFIEKQGGGLFWKMINKLGNLDIPKNVVTERLMSRRYVENLISLGDRNLFLAGMMSWTGFSQLGVPVLKMQRKGNSTYSAMKRIKLATEAITSFSVVPLKMMFNLGILITLASILGIVFIVIRKLIFPEQILIGYTSLMIMIMLALGIIVCALGIIGMYISKIFIQTQNRPLYIIKNIYA